MKRDTTKTKFYNKDGSLNLYSLACGYIEKHDKNDIAITLYKDSIYHVRAYDFKNNKRLQWLTFESLSKARKEFYRYVTVYQSSIMVGQQYVPLWNDVHNMWTNL